MVRVLQSLEQVEQATSYMARRGLPLHKTRQKNWDHWLLVEQLGDISPTARIVDLGCGGGYALRLMHNLGFRDICGIDFDVPPIRFLDRLGHLVQPNSFRTCFAARKGDICKTELPPDSCDFLACISVIEHGVDIEEFMAEAARILRPDGRIFLTIDYWENREVDGEPAVELFGLPWTIFDRNDVAGFLSIAEKNGLTPLDSGDIPPCRDTTVQYAGRDYTFLAMALVKRS